MAKSILSASHFQDEIAAFAYVEAHLWSTGPTCPHCGNVDQAKIGALKGATTRIGLRKCYECKKPFTVRMGTIFESSHLALRYWLQVIHLMCASKKGEYVRGTAYTNTFEGYFSVFKRGMIGASTSIAENLICIGIWLVALSRRNPSSNAHSGC